MIQVVAKHTVKAGEIGRYIELAGELVSKTRRLDAGCIRYGLFQDVKDPAVLTILEEWESQDALDRHGASAHFRELVPKLGALCEKPAEVNLYRPVEER